MAQVIAMAAPGIVVAHAQIGHSLRDLALKLQGAIVHASTVPEILRHIEATDVLPLVDAQVLYTAPEAKAFILSSGAV